VSLKISKSESAESEEREREDLRCFSFASKWEVELDDESLADVDKVRNGILAGRRDWYEEGILRVVELFSSSPSESVGVDVFEMIWSGVRCS
jgi:hypothetical protein